MQSKGEEVKAEKRKLAECARYAREGDERVMAAARTSGTTAQTTAESNDATTDKKLRNGGEKTARRGRENGLLFVESALLFARNRPLFSPPLPLSHRRRVKGARRGAASPKK